MIVYSRCPKIVILGEAAGPDRLDQFLFEAPVGRVLDGIAKTRVGRAVLDEIAARPHQVTIIPFRDTLPPNASSGAVLASGDRKDVLAAVAARTVKGRPVMLPDTSKPGVCRDVPLRVNGKVLRGTGAGTDEVVQFTPRHWSGEGRKLTAETVLVHELTHSLRAAAGAMQRKSLCNAFDDQEEFFAVLVENLFRSECAKGGQQLMLRWHHHGHTEMPPKLADPAFFFRFHRQRIVQIEREMPRFITKLMDIRDIAFNPFAAKNRAG
jgi:hypothetical protein